MSFAVEFGSMGGADAAREEHAEHVCPLDDDKRQKKVHFKDDTPELVRDQLEAGAQTGRAERDEGTGQAELTDAEKNRVGPFTGKNNYRKAAAVKALFRDNGVSDWSAWYDSELSVDEHRSSVLPEAQQAGGGDRIENEGPDRDAAARAEKAAHGQCDHAKNVCGNGDPEACEFLRESCGVPEEEVATLLDYADSVPYEELSGETKGGLDRAWSGYKTGVRKLATLLDEVAIELRHAEKAAATIDAIEEGISDMETGQFEALEAHHETLHQLHRRHPGDEHGQPGEGRDPTDDDLASAEPGKTPRPAAGPPPESDQPAATGALDLEAPTSEELQVPDQQHDSDMAERAAAVGPWDSAVSRSEAASDQRKDPSEMRDEELFAEVMERLDTDDGDGQLNIVEGVHERPSEGQAKLADDVEPERDGPSEEHRRAQNNGYLRGGSRGFEKDASAREGLGQFAATGGEKTLEEFDDDE